MTEFICNPPGVTLCRKEQPDGFIAIRGRLACLRCPPRRRSRRWRPWFRSCRPASATGRELSPARAPGTDTEATALVHDVYLRLLQDSQLSWQNRAHFFGIAARSMRQILIERARSRHAAKRGGTECGSPSIPACSAAAPD